jgi:hypothetical protein
VVSGQKPFITATVGVSERGISPSPTMREILKKPASPVFQRPALPEVFRQAEEADVLLRTTNMSCMCSNETMSYEEVTEIFVRVNSLGAKLKSSDLALAQMTSRWRNLLKELETFQEECETELVHHRAGATGAFHGGTGHPTVFVQNRGQHTYREAEGRLETGTGRLALRHQLPAQQRWH